MKIKRTVISKKRVSIGERSVFYSLQKSTTSKSIRLTVYPDGRMTVSTPTHLPQNADEVFVKNKWSWIEDKLNYFKKFTGRTVLRGGRREYLKHKESARTLAHERLEYFNQFYNFIYRTIAIRDQKSRWGSCSKRGNLNFNYKIAKIDPELADYVIVHELCHLGQFNHSKAFWDLVSKTIPNHKELRDRLKKGKLII